MDRGIPKRFLTPEDIIRDYAILIPRGGTSVYVNRADFQTISDLDLARRLADAVVQTGQRDGVPVYTSALKYFTGNADRHIYRDTAFTNKPLPETTLNLFRGLGVVPCKGACEKILTHIREVLCSSDETVFFAMIYLMAWQLQNIGTPSRTPVGLISEQQQVGKSMILEMLVRIWGSAGRKIDQIEQITGRFNDPIRGTGFILLEEVLFHGDHRAARALKGMTTATIASVESKGLPTVNIPLGLNIWFTSNDENAAFLEKLDDRYWILQVSPHRHGDHKYFAELIAEIKNGGEEAFADYLLTLDIGDFTPWRDILKENEAKIAMTRLSINPFDAQRWLEDSARAGVVLGLYQGLVEAELYECAGNQRGAQSVDLKIAMASGGTEWTETSKFEQPVLWKAYTNWQATVRSAVRPVPTPSGSFGEVLKNAGFGRKREPTGDRKMKSILPSRAKCLLKLGAKIEGQLAEELKEEIDAYLKKENGENKEGSAE